MDDIQTESLPAELEKLTHLLDTRPECLATGDSEMAQAALDAAKYIFDLSLQSEETSQPHISDLLFSLAPSQIGFQTRSQAKGSARAQAQSTLKQAFEPTPLKSLFVDGMDEEQIWAQLDLRTKAICQMLDFVLEGEVDENEDEEGKETDDEDEEEDEDELSNEDEGLDMETLMKKYGLTRDDFTEVTDDSEEGDMDQELDEDDDEGSDEDDEDEESEDEEGEGGEEEDMGSESESDEAMEVDESPKRPPKRKRSKNASELDDDFFNLEEFNAYTERAEAKSSSRGRLGDDSDDSEDDVELDLFNDPGADAEDDDVKDILYNDFFEPIREEKKPASKGKRGSKRAPKAALARKPHHEKPAVEEDDDDDDESDEGSEASGSESFGRIKHDLFAEEEEEIQDDQTAHEKRMEALQEQITELEKQNIEKKDWVLMGEATAKGRPQNSLLEEDLEFERVRKAVPLITEEAVKTLEEKIKARILENRYDDVVRMSAGSEKPFLPSKFFELQDAKSNQSLAQIYENDYMDSQGAGPGDDRDGKLKREHDEISGMWDKICGKLDALCNAHFVPKAPKATISTLSNTASASLESALPTTKSVSTMLAPEEVFAAGSAIPVARSEMNPAEKRALRTKERKLKAKQRQKLETSVDKFAARKSVRQQKKSALESVVKSGKGVTVIGKEKVKGKAKKERKAS